MDGNGRWAKKRGLPRIAGHKIGAESVRAVVDVSLQAGVRYLTLYSFSTENWKRPKAEVSFLMKLIEGRLRLEGQNLYAKNVKVRFIGRTEQLPASILKTMDYVKELTCNNTGLNLIFAINYGGRQEIIDAVKKALDANIKSEDFNEAAMQGFLYKPDIPDPDLIIRTADERRLSNFLLWQAAYAEFYFTQILWPDFGKEEFSKALSDYGKRNRKFGALG